MNPPVYYSSPAYDQASAFGAHFECDYDPRSYPTHGEFEQEERYRGVTCTYTLEEGDLVGYEEEEGEIERHRPWLPQNGARSEGTTWPGGEGVARNELPTELEPVAGTSSGSTSRISSVIAQQATGGKATGTDSIEVRALIPKAICDDIPELLTIGISTEQSKSTSKEFSLV